MPTPARSTLVAALTDFRNRPGTNPVQGPEFFDFFASFLDFLDNSGTFALGNTLATYAVTVDQTIDFNTLTTSAVWGCAATSAWTSAKNAPVGQSKDGVLLVLATATRITQVFTPHDRAFAASRTRLGSSTWSAWRSLSGRYSLPNFNSNNTWVKLGTFSGGSAGEVCEIRFRSNQSYNNQSSDGHLNALLTIRNGNATASTYNVSGMFYSLGGGKGSGSKIKAVRLVPVSQVKTDTNYLVYVQVDQFSGNGYYEVSLSPGCDWTHDGSSSTTTPTETLFWTPDEWLVVNSPLLALGRLNLTGLGTYASDSAAGTAGLVAGDVYKDSSGNLHIKL